MARSEMRAMRIIQLHAAIGPVSNGAACLLLLRNLAVMRAVLPSNLAVHGSLINGHHMIEYCFEFASKFVILLCVQTGERVQTLQRNSS